ncbi:MAG: prepilin-type N-terminal cleavage/methylation domain-containing protein [Candidatus Omnitrophica bacterium]|nr:prepilin-type N-terminal cleavage/methylation domain-containing protein [Candidatus Omnitrophota bacterium]
MRFKKEAFSLIECLISFLLLSIVMVGGMAFFSYPYESVTLSVHRRAAAEIAHAKMEEIKNDGFESLPEPLPPSPGLWQGPLIINLGDLTAWQKIYVRSLSGTNAKNVQITIDWTDPASGNPEQFALDTLIKR